MTVKQKNYFYFSKYRNHNAVHGPHNLNKNLRRIFVFFFSSTRSVHQKLKLFKKIKNVFLHSYIFYIRSLNTWFCWHERCNKTFYLFLRKSRRKIFMKFKRHAWNKSLTYNGIYSHCFGYKIFLLYFFYRQQFHIRLNILN